LQNLQAKSIFSREPAKTEKEYSMKFQNFRTVSLYLIVFFSTFWGQGLPSGSQLNQVMEILGVNSEKELQQLQQPAKLNLAVDPEEYYVDVGDEFIIKIDVKGPSTQVFTTTVYPEGVIVLEDVPSVYVRHLLLAEAKKKIIKSLRKQYKEAIIEVFLYGVHEIEVYVLGAVENPGLLTLKSTDRLYIAFQKAMEKAPGEMDNAAPVYSINKADELKELEKFRAELAEEEKQKKQMEEYLISLRNVTIERDSSELTYDLVRFEKLRDMDENPYLRDGDIIHFPFADQEKYRIHVDGAVGNPVRLEYKTGETLASCLALAGGVLPSADSSQIELFRFTQDSAKMRNQTLSFYEDSDFILQPDDRIFVKYKPQFNEKSGVEVLGEVLYPGEYGIIDGETTLREIIRQAGQFTPRASLENAMVIRTKFLPEDKELDRLRKIPIADMTSIEQSYLKLRSRENLRLVSVDFVKLFDENELTENVILRDEDVIMIPEVKNIVYVSGGVIAPGNITYNPRWGYADYIAAAGGYNVRAQETRTKVIKGKTGVWLDAQDEDFPIEEGDIVFVPEDEETDWYFVFKETLTITFQLATIALLIANLMK
jgi:protein involved in polysaccharide export with SLBB domain